MLQEEKISKILATKTEQQRINLLDNVLFFITVLFIFTFT